VRDLRDFGNQLATVKTTCADLKSGGVAVPHSGGGVASLAAAIRGKQDVLKWSDVKPYDGRNYLPHVRSLDVYMASNQVTSYDALDTLVYGTKCTTGAGKVLYDRLYKQSVWEKKTLTVTQCLNAFLQDKKVDLQELRKP